MPSGLRFFFAIMIGAFFAGVFGLLIGIPVLRLKGDYLAIVTLAFGEIIKNLVNIMFVGRDENGFHISFTNTMDLNMSEDGDVIIKGAQGITGTPHDSSFTIGIVLLLITLFIVLNLIHSRDGRAIMAIRDNTIAAESVGIHITKYKLMAFSISAALAGVAGVLYAHNLSTLTALPKNFGYNMSIMILVKVLHTIMRRSGDIMICPASACRTASIPLWRQENCRQRRLRQIFSIPIILGMNSWHL